MTLLITAVLTLAALQSFCKLALVPRRWEIISALMLSGLPFCFEIRIAHFSLREMNSGLSSPETLSNWCALVVIQELSAVIAGGAMLAGLHAEEPPQTHWKRLLSRWKCLAFLPSLLLPTGVLYLQMHLFNTWVKWEFHHISWLLATVLPLLLILTAESFRLIFRTGESRILAVAQGECLLLLSAIFLPVAATAKFVPAQNGGIPRESLYLLLALVVFELVTIIIFHVSRRSKKNVCCHSNS